MKSEYQIHKSPDGTYLDSARFSFGANELITFGNDGGEIVHTNYFDTERGRRGMYYLSMNAGAARLLIPDNSTHVVREMQTAKFCVLTGGMYGTQASVEIMFEDMSSSPFALFIATEMCELMPRSRKEPFILSAWTRAGKVGQWTAFERVGKRLPDLQPWK